MEGLAGLADAMDGVMAQIRQKFKDASKQEGALESFRAFLAAVDWTEPWIQGLVAVQLIFFLAAVLSRNRVWLSGFLFALAAATVSFAERLNGILNANWRQFAKQPYFDRQGIFFSALVSAPLLFTMFFLLVNYLASASSLLVKMKRKELRYHARQRAKQENERVAETPAPKSAKKAK